MGRVEAEHAHGHRPDGERRAQQSGFLELVGDLERSVGPRDGQLRIARPERRPRQVRVDVRAREAVVADLLQCTCEQAPDTSHVVPAGGCHPVQRVRPARTGRERREQALLQISRAADVARGPEVSQFALAAAPEGLDRLRWRDRGRQLVQLGGRRGRTPRLGALGRLLQRHRYILVRAFDRERQVAGPLFRVGRDVGESRMDVPTCARRGTAVQSGGEEGMRESDLPSPKLDDPCLLRFVQSRSLPSRTLDEGWCRQARTRGDQ